MRIRDVNFDEFHVIQINNAMVAHTAVGRIGIGTANDPQHPRQFYQLVQ